MGGFWGLWSGALEEPNPFEGSASARLRDAFSRRRERVNTIYALSKNRAVSASRMEQSADHFGLRKFVVKRHGMLRRQPKRLPYNSRRKRFR